jgi:hypothetical protein
MTEFIVGFFFFICGAALLIHNKSMVEGSIEFHRPYRQEDEDKIIFFDRVLCVLAGIVALASGLMTMILSYDKSSFTSIFEVF